MDLQKIDGGICCRPFGAQIHPQIAHALRNASPALRTKPRIHLRRTERKARSRPSRARLNRAQLAEGRLFVGAVWDGGPAGPETMRSGIEGSPDYMAPERFRSAAYGPAADIYAFGLILFEMAAGRRPFPAEELLPAALRRSMEDAARVGEFGGPERWDRAIARALGRDPGARQSSAGGVLSEMK